MTKFLEIYKCQICGNIVEIVHTGAGELICCNQAMKNNIAGTVDASKEKHIPVLSKDCSCSDICIKVGDVPHPMTEDHYIEWIEYIADGVSSTHYLKPGDNPQTCFNTTNSSFTVREYCNLHGLWETKF